RSCSALTLGSSPYTSSPTLAFAIAARIPADGCVTVSLRKSMIRSMSDLRIEAHLHLLGRAQYRAGLVLGLLPFALGDRIGDDAGGRLHVQHPILDDAGANSDREVHVPLKAQVTA